VRGSPSKYARAGCERLQDNEPIRILVIKDSRKIAAQPIKSLEMLWIANQWKHDFYLSLNKQIEFVDSKSLNYDIRAFWNALAKGEILLWWTIFWCGIYMQIWAENSLKWAILYPDNIKPANTSKQNRKKIILN